MPGSLSIYAGVDEYGFLVTPYYKVTNGKLGEIVRLRADEEMRRTLTAFGRRLTNPSLGDFITLRVSVALLFSKPRNSVLSCRGFQPRFIWILQFTRQGSLYILSRSTIETVKKRRELRRSL